MGKLAELLVFGFAPLVLGVIALPEILAAEQRTVSGEISYRERIALPPQAVVTVELADISLADAPATIVGKQQITNPGQVPVKFSIAFDKAVLQTGVTYAIQVRITVDNELWFVTDQRYDVDPLSTSPVQIVVKSAH